MENDAVLYRERECGYKLARVVKVDNAVDPPGYVVEVDGAERSTEASRLAPAPKPRRRSDGGNNGGSDSDGCVDASAAFAPPSHARGGAEGGAEGAPSRSDMALAHEMAMEAAQCLDTSRGDHVGAKDFLVKAMEALDSERRHDGLLRLRVMRRLCLYSYVTCLSACTLAFVCTNIVSLY